MQIEVGDVHDVFDRHKARFDAILPDGDNGSEGLITIGNERLYRNWGLRSRHDVLRAGGTLAGWSSFSTRISATA